VAPDLVHASGDVSSGNLTFAIQFAAGTLDSTSTRVSILLDTDESATTGIAESTNFGADSLDLNTAAGLASITKANPVACAAHATCFDPIGSVPVTVIADGVRFAVPLTMLQGSDGRMLFRMHSYVLVAALTAVTFDHLPNVELAAVRIQ
jgi:hypothetical protein